MAILVVAAGGSAARADLVPAQTFLVLRVHTEPGPLVSGAPGTVTLEGKGFLTPTLAFSFSGPTSIVIDSMTIESDSRATLSVTVPPASTGRHVLTASTNSGQLFGGSFVWVDTAAGTFHAVQPIRVLDTRIATGFPRRLQASEAITLDVTGIGDIPATGVAAITANLTAVVPTDPGYLTIWPSGVAQPVVSNVNFPAGAVVPNQVTVGVGPDGTVQLFNFAGTTDVLLDVVGWFATETAPLGATYRPSVVDRILDTRGTLPVAARGTLRVPVVPGSTVDGFGIPSAVVANVTVTRPASDGFVTVFPAGAVRPNTSTHNFRPGQSTANMITVRLGDQNSIDLYNGSDGPLDVIVDLVAYFSFDEPVPYRFEAASTPFRVLDSRTAPLSRPLKPSEAWGIALGGPGGIPATAAIVVGNVTATGSDGSGYMNITHGTDDPGRLSVVNYDVGQTVANQFHSTIGVFTRIVLYNFTSNAHGIVDVFGWFGYG